jgi:hypothetical protein
MLRGFLVTLIMLLPWTAWSQSEANGSISGFVYDAADGEAMISASIYFDQLEIGTVTNASGYYVLPRVPVGTYMLRSSFIGYEDFQKGVTVGAGEQVKLDIVLTVQAVGIAERVIHADSVRTSEKLFRKPVSKVELSGRQISQIPQIAEADLLRALQSLPGILPLSDFSSALYVRGGTPDQNLYMIDGTDVYNPEHAFGLFSTFNTDAIKQVELSKGGFGAEYGGRLSSILDVTNLDGNREQFEGTAAISLLSAKTTLQMPLGSRGSLSGSVRRTYFDQTIGRRLKDIPDYYFYDGNVKAFFDLNESNKLTLSFYGGRDFLDVVFNNDSSDNAGFHTDWGNKTGSARWTRIFNPSLFGIFWVTYSRFSSDFSLDEINIDERNFVQDLTLKGNLEYHYSSELVAKFGFEQKNLDVLFRQEFPGGKVDVKSKPEHYVGYALGEWKPTPLWDIQGGLRYNLFRSDKTFQNVAPRLAAKYRLSDVSTVKGAFGLYHQYLNRVPRFIATDIWTSANKNETGSSSYHLIGGYQREIDRDYQLELEGFYKSYNDIYSFNQTFLTELETTTFDADGQPIFDNTKGIFHQIDGHSTGFEALLRKDVGTLTGWLAYAYSRTEYKTQRINQGDSFFPRHDRSSTVNLVANVDLKNMLRKIGGKTSRQHKGNWKLSFNGVYTTGQPITEPGSVYFVASSPDDPSPNLEYAPTRINNIRLPYYARLDISLTYKRRYSWGSFSPYIQLFNAGNRRNVWFVNYDFNDGMPDPNEQYMFPVLPTIGFNFEF